MQKILITGVNGFVGYHVAQILHEKGHIIIGAGSQKNIALDLKRAIRDYVCVDLTQPNEVSEIDLSKIDAIINLAGLANVGGSRGKGDLYNTVNVGVHTVLYNECLRQNVRPRIIAVSTGAVYDPNQELPITEDSKLVAKAATNEYVVSKQLMEEALGVYAERGLNIIIARPFNHSGPGQLPGFLLPDLGDQIAEAMRSGKPLRVGNLRTRRDYTDVRDVAQAYVQLATCDEASIRHDVYNICSGTSTEGGEILRLLARALGQENIDIEVDQSRIRPNDVMDIYGSYERLHEDIGWKPAISVEQMVRDFAHWKREQIA